MVSSSTLKESPDTLETRLKRSLQRTKKAPIDFHLSEEYTISKFYELGYKVRYNKYENTYLSCCPICREGKSWGRKKRCYYIPENDNIYCHNCGSSLKPYNWIREVSGMTDAELRRDMESFCPSDGGSTTKPEQTVAEAVPTLPEDSINLFDPLQVEFYKHNHVVQAALKMIEDRRLKTAANGPDALYVSLKDFTHKNRLIIPFKSVEGKILFYQSRKILDNDEKPSYISKTGGDKSVCGIDRVNPDKDCVFIFEGPIDSFFVKNGLALAGITSGNSSFTALQQSQLEELKFFRKIWVLDSQWIDKTSREKTLKLLERGECVFIWPKKWGKYKDFNEICVTHSINEISPEFIIKNSFCGNVGLLKYKIIFHNM